MKKITKIKLINWHVFYNETIEVQGNILLTGENGSGKSTIMDAIHFLLSGGNAKFNTAASTEASRTIETYMRGKLGYENRKFLRNDDNLISHIALEYYDDLEKRPLVLGAVFEIRENSNKPQVNFYRIIGKGLDDSWFFEEDNGVTKIVNFHRFDKKFQAKYGKPDVSGFKELGGSKKDIRRQIADLLSISYELEKYYELLPKAMAFRPIAEVKDFVFRFLLPQKDIDLETMRQSMQAYRELQQKISIDEVKLERLGAITELGDQYRKGALEQKLLQAYEKKLVRDSIYDKIALARSQIHILSPQVDALRMRYKNEETDIEEVRNQKLIFQHSDSFQALKVLQERIDTANGQIIFKEREVKELNHTILEQSKRAKELGISTNIGKYVTEYDYPAFIKEAVALRKKMEEGDEEMRSKLASIKGDIANLSSEIEAKRKIEEQLRSGVMNYDRNVTVLQRLIKDGIRQYSGIDIPVIPFCELIDIKKGCEEWRNAVEGYLNTRRMDLFVPDLYYDEALRIYERCKKDYSIFGVGLVNCAKIKKIEPLENSLATKVEALDERAELYLNYILGDVICVDSEDDLKNYECAITRTVMVYRNKAARQTRAKVYEVPFIGRKALEIQHDSIAIEIDKMAAELRSMNAEASHIESRLRISMTAIQVALALEKTPDTWGDLNALKARLIKLEEEKKEADEGGALTLQLDGYNARIHELELKKEKTHHELIDLEAQLQNQRTIDETLGVELQEAKKVLDELLSDPNFQSQFDTYEKKNKLSPNEVKTKLVSYQTTLAKLEAKIEALMKAYIQEFSFDSQATIENLDDFFKESNLVVARDLQQFKSRAEEVKEQALKGYKENYIAVIRRNVREATASIGKLNKILATMPFGPDEEIYCFEYGRTSDPRFKDYYDIFDSNQEFDPRELFTTQLSNANLRIMEELFERLTREPTSEQEEKLLREFTDYRKFMEYDIRITNKRGETAFFSAINREKSGGELQTPFYVIIGASFDQIALNGFGRRSPGCLVMLDEVFDKMDGDRISAMMKYFTQLTSIQLIMAAPTDRGRIIMPYVDTSIGIVKSNNRARAISLIKDE